MLADRRLPTILIVEDDQCLAQVLCRVLSRSGYEIEWAANVADAVRELDRAPVVALLDLHLPDGNGVDAVAIARKIYRAAGRNAASRTSLASRSRLWRPDVRAGGRR